MLFSSLFFKSIVAVFAVSFLLNLFWEVSHSVLYEWNTPPLQNSVLYYVPRILQSTLGDAVMILLIFLLNSLRYFSVEWVSHPRKSDFAAMIVLGLLFAIFIEVRAMNENRWSYSEYMPLVFGIGLTPLIQLSITGILTLLLAGALL